VPHCLSADSKHVISYDFESALCVKFCFAPVPLAFRYSYTCSERRWRTFNRKEQLQYSHVLHTSTTIHRITELAAVTSDTAHTQYNCQHTLYT